ncbi:MAG: hypothetical protein GY826_26915, partial [Fuerstiella sp.]|nr:hypothetical protein [Fuerstiella sp.]
MGKILTLYPLSAAAITACDQTERLESWIDAYLRWSEIDLSEESLTAFLDNAALSPDAREKTIARYGLPASAVASSSDEIVLAEYVSAFTTGKVEMDTATLQAFMANSAVTDHHLTWLLESYEIHDYLSDDEVEAVAESTDARAPALTQLASSKSNTVRRQVAANPRTPDQVRKELKKDPVKEVQRAPGKKSNVMWL